SSNVHSVQVGVHNFHLSSQKKMVAGYVSRLQPRVKKNRPHRPYQQRPDASPPRSNRRSSTSGVKCRNGIATRGASTRKNQSCVAQTGCARLKNARLANIETRSSALDANAERAGFSQESQALKRDNRATAL